MRDRILLKGKNCKYSIVLNLTRLQSTKSNLQMHTELICFENQARSCDIERSSRSRSCDRSLARPLVSMTESILEEKSHLFDFSAYMFRHFARSRVFIFLQQSIGSRAQKYVCTALILLLKHNE